MASIRTDDLTAELLQNQAQLRKKQQINNQARAILKNSSHAQLLEHTVRPASMQELFDILQSPYQQVNRPPIQSVKATSNRNGKRKSSMVPQSGPASNIHQEKSGGRTRSIPFGSRSRRPIGQESLDQMVEYTYIPDIRKLNAMSNVQFKEERMAQLARQKQSQKLLRGQASLSSLVYSSSKPASNPTYDNKNLHSKQTINRSKSTVAGYSTNHVSHEKHFHLPKLLQPQSSSNLFRNLETSTEKQITSKASSRVDVHPTSTKLEQTGDKLAELSQSPRPAADWHKEQAGMITIQENEDRQDETMLNTQLASDFQGSKQDHKLSAEYELYINAESSSGIPRQKESARYHDQIQSSGQVLQQDNPSRMLLKESSVQQMSHATLLPDTQRQQPTSQRKRKSKSTRRIKLKPTGTGEAKKTRDIGTSSSFNQRTSLSPFDSLVQSRKLAPQINSPQKQKMHAAESQAKILSQQAAIAENQVILDNLAGEFLDQLNGINRESPTSESRSSINLPYLSQKSVASLETQQTRGLAKSRMHLQNRRAQKQTQDQLMQQRELFSVISAQKLLDPSEIETKPNHAYLTQQHGSRVDLVIAPLDCKNESKIPPKILQQELTNERIYTKSAIPQKSKKTGKKRGESVDPVLRHERISKSSLKEIIPRLTDFPMQGKTIQVKGHQDDKVFSASRRKEELANDYKNQHAVTTKLAAPSQMDKMSQNWKAIHRSRKSIDLILSGVKQNRSISHIGVREHYLDDELKGRHFMKNVAPTSYEIFEKQVVVPNLYPQVTPAAVYKDAKEGITHQQKLAAKNQQVQAQYLSLSIQNSNVASKTGTAAIASTGDYQQERRYQFNSPRKRHKSGIDSPLRRSDGTDYTPGIMEAKMSMLHQGGIQSRNFTKQESSTVEAENPALQKTPSKMEKVTKVASNQHSIQTSMQLSVDAMTLGNTASHMGQPETNLPELTIPIVVAKLESEELYPQQVSTQPIDENYTGLMVEKKSLVRRESKEKFNRDTSGETKLTPSGSTSVLKKNFPIKGKLRNQGTELLLGDVKQRLIQDGSTSPWRQSNKALTPNRQATQQHGQTKFTATVKSNNAQSNMDIDDVLDQQEQKLSRNVSHSNLVQEQASQLSQNQKLPSEMYARQEAETRQKKSPFKQNSLIKNQKGIVALSQISKQNQNMSSRDLPSKTIQSSKTTDEKIQVPQMVSYKIQGAVYGGGQRADAESDQTTFRQNFGTSSHAIPSSVEMTPLRPVPVTNFSDKTKTMTLINGHQHSEKPETKENSAQATTVRNSEKATLQISLSQAPTLNGQSQIRIKKVVVQDAASNIRYKNYGSPDNQLQNTDEKPASTIQFGGTQESDSSPIKALDNFAPLAYDNFEQLVFETDPPLDIATIQHLLTITDQVQLRNGNQMISDTSAGSVNQTGTQKMPLKQMIQQVKEARMEREIRQKRGNIVSGSAVVGTEARFKHESTKQSEATPGPGSYEVIYAKDISHRQPFKNQTITSVRAHVKKNKPLDANSHQGKIQDEDAEDKSKLTLAGQQMSRQPSTQKIAAAQAAAATIQRPSANFASKVPRDSSNEDKKLFTGSVDFNDQTANTISKAQNDLTLRTVQKMFAGRKEQHTLNVHKLVRINRLKQLNKVDPNINYTLPENLELPLQGESEEEGQIQYLPVPLQTNIAEDSDTESNNKFQAVPESSRLQDETGSFQPGDSFGFILIDDPVGIELPELTPNGPILNRDLQNMQQLHPSTQDRYQSHDLRQFSLDGGVNHAGLATRHHLEVVHEKRNSAETILLPHTSPTRSNELLGSPAHELASLIHESSGIHSNRYSIQQSPGPKPKLQNKNVVVKKPNKK